MNTRIQQNCFAYRDYVIWLRSYELPTGGWMPRAVALLPPAQGGGEEEVVTPGTSPRRSREEADTYARALSQRWMEQQMARHEGKFQSPENKSLESTCH